VSRLGIRMTGDYNLCGQLANPDFFYSSFHCCFGDGKSISLWPVKGAALTIPKSSLLWSSSNLCTRLNI